MELEDRLRRGFRPVDPGDDFADRVLARLDADADAAARPTTRRSRAPWHRWALAASLLLAVALGTDAWRDHLHRERGAREASRQLAQALDITTRQLENVHRRLDQDTRKETGS